VDERVPDAAEFEVLFRETLLFAKLPAEEEVDVYSSLSLPWWVYTGFSGICEGLDADWEYLLSSGLYRDSASIW
jgi:hypothetical protein